MTVWFTSDLHIGHGFVAALRAGYPDQAEDVTTWHDERIATNWDENVNKDDQVWVLGDISAGGSQSQYKALDWLMDRPGRKHLIAGNHDGVHPMHRTAHKLHGRYQEAFITIASAATKKIPLPDGSHQKVLLSHFPYSGDHTPGDRFTQWRLPDEGLPLLHGHVHTDERWTISEGNGAKQIHVGLDAWDLTPITLEQVAELLV